MPLFPVARLSLLLVLATLLLSACAGRQSSGRLEPAPATSEAEAADPKAAQIWQRYSARAVTAEGMTGPFRISANLRYSDAEGKNTRASALLWGNGKAENPYPLRLDLLAGVGTVVAKVRESARNFTAYVPEENTAYVYDDGSRTLASFGVPIPLSLGDLTLLLTGRSGALFLPTSTHNDAGIPVEHSLTANGARYAIPDARLPGVLELSETGAPLSWTELRDNGWVIGFESGKMNPLQPVKLRISHPRGYAALIVVKEIARVSPPYSVAKMTLELPPGTEKKALDK